MKKQRDLSMDELVDKYLDPEDYDDYYSDQNWKEK